MARPIPRDPPVMRTWRGGVDILVEVIRSEVSILRWCLD
jgi:hypothetical protein